MRGEKKRTALLYAKQLTQTANNYNIKLTNKQRTNMLKAAKLIEETASRPTGTNHIFIQKKGQRVKNKLNRLRNGR